jgi:ribonuclease VapC
MELIQGKEPAASQVQSIVEGASRGEVRLSMSRMNHGECVYLVRKNLPLGTASMALSRVEALPIELLSVSDKLIDSAVDLKSVYPISFADAFAVAQAIELSCPLLTGDPDFVALEQAGVVRLHWVGA